MDAKRLLAADPATIVERELRIEAPPETVWAHWTDPARLVRWMGRTATTDPRPGGVFRVEYGSGDVTAGTYLELDPPRRLVLTWGWEDPGDPVRPGSSVVEVTLEPDGSATRLRLRHAGLDAASRPTHAEGWDHFLARLAEAVAAPG